MNDETGIGALPRRERNERSGHEITMVRASRRLTYSAQEVADILGVGRSSVYDSARKGELPAVRVGSRWLFPKSRIHELLEADGAPRGSVTNAG